jgi:cell division septation protein DedD
VPIVPPVQKDSVVQPLVDEMAVKTTAQDSVSPVTQTTESASLAAGTVTAQDYGLQQPFNTSLKTWFALVVHSLDLPEKAENQRLLLEKSGFRVAVQQAVVNEKNVWRVGIGQFEKVEDALRAAADLPEPFKNRYFVKRFSQ